MSMCGCALCLYICVGVYTQAHGSQRPASMSSSLDFWRQGLLNLEFADSARLAGQWPQGSAHASVSWPCAAAPCVYEGDWYLNLGPHACVTGTLPTEPSLSPLGYLFLVHKSPLRVLDRWPSICWLRLLFLCTLWLQCLLRIQDLCWQLVGGRGDHWELPHLCFTPVIIPVP